MEELWTGFVLVRDSILPREFGDDDVVSCDKTNCKFVLHGYFALVCDRPSCLATILQFVFFPSI